MWKTKCQLKSISFKNYLKSQQKSTTLSTKIRRYSYYHRHVVLGLPVHFQTWSSYLEHGIRYLHLRQRVNGSESIGFWPMWFSEKLKQTRLRQRSYRHRCGHVNCHKDTARDPKTFGALDTCLWVVGEDPLSSQWTTTSPDVDVARS